MATPFAPFFLYAAAALIGAAPAALSQVDHSAPPEVRTNLTRAARLTFLAGAVRVQRSDNTGDDAAVLNMPIPEGSRLVTADYGQAELEFEDGSVVRLTPNSALALNVLTLESASNSSQIAHSELTLLSGLAYFELRKSPAATWVLSSGGVSLHPLENLTLRLAFDQPPPVFAVLTGAARVTRPHGFDTDVRAGETLSPDAKDDTRYFLNQQVTAESWDAWNESRDQAAADAADRRTAARDSYAGGQGYGWSDLDASGNWYEVPGTGQVWQPYNADEGFEPYGYGSWVWGNGSYVWASGYPWGWTPFRCGHWQYFPSFGWGWTPDASCSIWSYAGGGYLTTGLGYGGGYAGDYSGGGGTYYGTGIFIRGPHPPRTPIPTRPQPRPGQPHPIIPVRGPDGPRPPTIHRGQVRIAGSTINALPTVAQPSSRSGSSLGRGIARDFPIDRTTRQPILGTESRDRSADRSTDRSADRNANHNADGNPARPTPGTRFPRQPSDATSPNPAAPTPAQTITTQPTTRRPAETQPDRTIAPPMGTGRIQNSIRTPNQAPASQPQPAPPQTIRPTPPPMQQQPAPQPQPRYNPPPQAPAPSPQPARPGPSPKQPALAHRQRPGAPSQSKTEVGD